MKRTLRLSATTVAILATLTTFRSSARAADITDAGINVQARGPLHEAFAQPTTAAPEPTPLVPKAPPDPIPEEPPDKKPDTPNVQWLPGYWSWDADKKDWLWVSGFWRAPPPARQWVPGHWTKADDGWRWIPGFWAPASQGEVNYLERPPDSLESGPSLPAPDENSIYVPGLWVFRGDRFLWRPGYWLTCRNNWIWCAAHYVWTPRGFVFVNGYWDYPLEDRGLLFAPVCFDRPLWTTPGWCFRPSCVVNIGCLFDCCWVCPSRCCYCFGNFYDPCFARLGFVPWFTFGARHHDPLFCHYAWTHRGNTGWVAGLNATFTLRSRGEVTRPPATLAAQSASLAANGIANTRTTAPALVTPLAQVTTVGTAKLTTLDAAQLSTQRQTVKQVRDLAVLRSQTETPKSSAAALSLTTKAIQSAPPKLPDNGVHVTGKLPDSISVSPANRAGPSSGAPEIIHFPTNTGQSQRDPSPAPAIFRSAPVVTAPSSPVIINRSATVSPPPARIAPPPPAPSGGGRGSSPGGGHSGLSGGGGGGHGGGGGGGRGSGGHGSGSHAGGHSKK
jgi:hypothetical protein